MKSTCGTYGGEESCVQGYGGENLRERAHFEDPGVDGWIILKWIFKKWDVGVWTGLSWLANAVMNLRVK